MWHKIPSLFGSITEMMINHLHICNDLPDIEDASSARRTIILAQSELNACVCVCVTNVCIHLDMNRHDHTRKSIRRKLITVMVKTGTCGYS